MDASLFLLGVAAGLAVAAPFGPVNLIVIRSTIRRGAVGGLAAGAGAVLADTGFAAIAGYGIRSIERFIFAYSFPMQLMGGALLVIIGIRTAVQHVRPTDLTVLPEAATTLQLWRKFATCLALTLTNPGALFGMLAVFGALSGTMKLGIAPYRPAIAVAGVAVGGALWWLVLSALVNRLKSRFTAAALDRINRWAGVVIAAFGFALLMDLIA